MPHEPKIDAGHLVSRKALTPEQWRLLTDDDHRELSEFLRLSGQYANGERILAAEMRPLERVPYVRRSLIRAHVFAATIIALPGLAALLLPAAVFVPLATVFAVVLITAWIVRHE